jgi:hypothetical protein
VPDFEMIPWHAQYPAEYEKQLAAVRTKYPQLHAANSESKTQIVGTLPVGEGETIIDRFAISIEIPTDYPQSLPIVREIGGRIPNHIDNHIVDSSGICCVMLPDQRWELWPEGSSLVQFIDVPVRNFFLGQALVALGQPWPFSEWSHGEKGHIEYYKTIFGTDDEIAIGKFLVFLYQDRVKGHWLCPCGNGRILRQCHFQTLLNLRRKIPRLEAEKMLRRFLKYTETKTNTGA